MFGLLNSLANKVDALGRQSFLRVTQGAVDSRAHLRKGRECKRLPEQGCEATAVLIDPCTFLKISIDLRPLCLDRRNPFAKRLLLKALYRKGCPTPRSQRLLNGIDSDFRIVWY
jgi:hypothetical protein